MYHHCVYCAADLGENQSIEEFPVGRRLAYDGEKGRLWVICRRCKRWNLSPLEERWEALESLERIYRRTRTRVSTEHIGLAKLAEGLEIIRVGRPQRPEFAAWRYGDQFGRRRRKAMLQMGVAGGWYGGFSAAVASGSAVLVGAAVAATLPLLLYILVNPLRETGKQRPLRLPRAAGGALELQPEEIGVQKIRPSNEHEEGWYLDLAPWLATGSGSPAGQSSKISPNAPAPILTGTDAVHALARITAHVNRAGAARRSVSNAVRAIEQAGSPSDYFRLMESEARRRGRGFNILLGLPVDLRLALEMAAHEDQERAALEGDLALLEEAWREAEILAAIADDLLLPDGLNARLDVLRTQFRDS